MVTALIVVSLLLLLAVPIAIENRDLLLERLPGRQRLRTENAGLPFLILPLAGPGHELVAPPQAFTPAADFAPPVPTTPRRNAGPIREEIIPAPRSHVPEPVFDEVFERASDDYVDHSSDTDDLATDATIIFRREGDEAVQLLPGRLRVMAGAERKEEIRLFGLIGEPVRVTLGREQGPPHRTVTLRSPTVSRRHARLDFADGVWRIRNLSRTNPVVVNDRTLDDPAATLALADGDRIELGEVVLQFVGR